MSRRPTSKATEHMLAATAEKFEAEVVATADPVMGDVARRSAARLAANATTPLTVAECAGLYRVPLIGTYDPGGLQPRQLFQPDRWVLINEPWY